MADEVLRLIDSIQLTAKHKVATPVNWKHGEDVIIVPTLSNAEAKTKFDNYAEFEALYEAEPVTGTSLIRITARTPDPDDSIRLCNVVVDTYIREHTYERNRQIIESRRFIEAQLGAGVDRLLGVQAVAKSDERLLGSVIGQSVKAHPQLVTFVIRDNVAR